MSDLKLHELPPSPNNKKARIGLAYKKLDYERCPIRIEGFPGDRSGIVKLSSQPLTPVLAHGDRVIFDSGAILRYLEANFPGTPRLFHDDYRTMKTIESWEWRARNEIAGAIGMVFAEAASPEPDLEQCRRATSLLHDLTGPIEAQLEKAAFLTGDQLTAADVTAAPYVWYSMQTSRQAADHPISRFFHDNLRLGDGRDRTRDWVHKVVELDPDYSA